MSTKLGSYVFKRDVDFEKAKESLYNQMSGDYNNSDKIYFPSSYGNDYIIEIYSECSNPRLVGQICSTYNGEPY